MVAKQIPYTKVTSSLLCTFFTTHAFLYWPEGNNEQQGQTQWGEQTPHKVKPGVKNAEVWKEGGAAPSFWSLRMVMNKTYIRGKCNCRVNN